MCKLIIGFEGQNYLMFTILGRQYPNSMDPDDGNWLNTDIQIVSGPFSGEVRALLRTDEFMNFKSRMEILHKTLKGVAEYRSLEEWVIMTIKGDGLGHFFTEGYVRGKPGGANKICFSFEFDQTIMPKIMNNLNKLIEEYPIRY